MFRNTADWPPASRGADELAGPPTALNAGRLARQRCRSWRRLCPLSHDVAIRLSGWEVVTQFRRHDIRRLTGGVFGVGDQRCLPGGQAQRNVVGVAAGQCPVQRDAEAAFAGG